MTTVFLKLISGVFVGRGWKRGFRICFVEVFGIKFFFLIFGKQGYVFPDLLSVCLNFTYYLLLAKFSFFSKFHSSLSTPPQIDFTLPVIKCRHLWCNGWLEVSILILRLLGSKIVPKASATLGRHHFFSKIFPHVPVVS